MWQFMAGDECRGSPWSADADERTEHAAQDARGARCGPAGAAAAAAGAGGAQLRLQRPPSAPPLETRGRTGRGGQVWAGFVSPSFSACNDLYSSPLSSRTLHDHRRVERSDPQLFCTWI